MNSIANPIQIWIFNDASIYEHIRKDSPLWKNQEPAVVLELAALPLLAPALGLKIPSSYQGLEGLLDHSNNLSSLLNQIPKTESPLIFSSNQAVNPDTIIPAIRRLKSDNTVSGLRVILIHSSIVEGILPVLFLADYLGMAWDLSLPPQKSINHLLDQLTEEGLIRSEKWTELFTYFSKDHMAHEEEREQAKNILSDFHFSQLI